MLCKPYFVRPKIRHHAAGGTFSPVEVAQAYNYGKVHATTAVPIACIELGGGYHLSDFKSAFQAWNLPMPNMRDIGILGSGNHPGSDADSEVILDGEVAAAGFSSMTDLAASLLMIFGPNSTAGFSGAIDAAVHISNVPGVISISWGGAERDWDAQDIAKMEQSFKIADAAGWLITVASGDNGQGDGAPGLNTDYPGTSPYAVCCGGTTLTIVNGKPVERVWNNVNGGAAGGGFSTVFPSPLYQAGFLPTGVKTRGVPDLAANADPQTGYRCMINGQWDVIGGTSAVAPLLAGYFAALMSSGVSLKGIHDLLYKHADCFNDVTLGEN